jgi:phage tail sheath protein FI
VTASYVIQNICELRGDCVAFVSPDVCAVSSTTRRRSGSHHVLPQLTAKLKLRLLRQRMEVQYDKYNDKYRWVPLNGDMAGLAARTDTSNDPWFSPAGFTRGNVKNVIKLAWNPKQQDRDDLYKIGVNPVVSFPSQGVVLYGDKTLLDRPSRSTASTCVVCSSSSKRRLRVSHRRQLFEFNDEFTRSQFRNIVEPYLRDVKARRGVIDYRVICDDSNNTSEVVEQNRFVGDIYVKPSAPSTSSS